GPAPRLGDALVAPGELYGQLLALLLDLRDRACELGLLLLRPGRGLIHARIGELGIKRGELVDLRLVLGRNATGLLFLTSVDLAADATSVLGDKSRHLRAVAVRVAVDEQPHHVLRAQLV